MLDVATDRSWIMEAACRGLDPSLFFPETGRAPKEARQVCETCEVRIQCQNYALANGEKWGVWGGLAELDRRRIRSNIHQGRMRP